MYGSVGKTHFSKCVNETLCAPCQEDHGVPKKKSCATTSAAAATMYTCFYALAHTPVMIQTIFEYRYFIDLSLAKKISRLSVENAKCDQRFQVKLGKNKR